MGPPPAGTATTGADGAFTINGLKKGTYLLTAKHADFAPYTAKGVEISNAQSSPYRITLGKGGTARGQFLADGQPKANMMIQLMGPNGVQMAMTDSEGRFEVKGLPAGTYMVNALDIAAMAGNGGDDGTFPNMNYKSVTVTEGGDVVIPFGGGVVVSGTVPPEHMGKMTLVYLVRKGAPDMPSLDGIDALDPEVMMETGMQMMQYMAGMADVKADGSFSFSGIDPGEYEVRIYASNVSMQDIDPSEFMNVPLDEMQEHAQGYMPKQVFAQPVTVGDQPMTVDLTKPPAESTP